MLFQSLNSEIHEQKTKSLDLFGSVTECEQRAERSKDPQYRDQVSARALDPVSGRHMRNIQAQAQYMGAALNEVNAVLDSQWDEYQNSKNKNK